MRSERKWSLIRFYKSKQTMKGADWNGMLGTAVLAL